MFHESLILFTIFLISDRQRNDEKKRLAYEENLRIEAERERKRKAAVAPKVYLKLDFVYVHFESIFFYFYLGRGAQQKDQNRKTHRTNEFYRYQWAQ